MPSMIERTTLWPNVCVCGPTFLYAGLASLNRRRCVRSNLEFMDYTCTPPTLVEFDFARLYVGLEA
jgi:hypothetical protein